LNVALTPLFIDGLGLGVTGAALATNLARGVAVVIGLFQLRQLVGLRYRDLRLRGELVRILRIGAPMAMGTAFFAAVYWALLKTAVSPLGPHINAALGIGFSALEGFTWPIYHGLALAVASYVGRCLGAGRSDLAKQVIWKAAPIASLCGALASLTFFTAGEGLVWLFTGDPVVHQAATEYAIILAASQLFLAWEALGEGVLAGAGDTKTVFWCSAPFNLLRIPLAWFLAFPMGAGAAGIWWAINITTYAKAGCKIWAVSRGKWVHLAP
jgi:MATE family multidrug resistance protein